MPLLISLHTAPEMSQDSNHCWSPSEQGAVVVVWFHVSYQGLGDRMLLECLHHVDFWYRLTRFLLLFSSCIHIYNDRLQQRPFNGL